MTIDDDMGELVGSVAFDEHSVTKCVEIRVRRNATTRTMRGSHSLLVMTVRRDGARHAQRIPGKLATEFSRLVARAADELARRRGGEP